MLAPFSIEAAPSNRGRFIRAAPAWPRWLPPPAFGMPKGGSGFKEFFMLRVRYRPG